MNDVDVVWSVLRWVLWGAVAACVWMFLATLFYFLKIRWERHQKQQELKVLQAIRDGHHIGTSLLQHTRMWSGTLYPILIRLEVRGEICSMWQPYAGRYYYWIPVEQVAPGPADQRFRKTPKASTVLRGEEP